MIIYQVFPRLFGNDNPSPVKNGSKATNGCGTMSDFTTKALEEIRGLGATYIWYTGIIMHATQTDYSQYGIKSDNPAVVKGKAGSPYAIRDYYDVDPDLATKVENRMQEFSNLIRRTHRAGLGVIIDFVPNHVARQYHSNACPDGVEDLGAGDNREWAFSSQNNFYYLPGQELTITSPDESAVYQEFPAKATGNDVFSASPSRDDWYETVKLNYGVDICSGRIPHFNPIPNTWKKMLHILLYWVKKGIDGFRCDMAEMVPVEFWEWVIPQVKRENPNIVFIAEVYNPAEYRNYIYKGHFDYLYDKVGLYDTLKAVSQLHCSAQSITYCWQSVDDIRRHMLYFLENHDEQRISSDFFVCKAEKGRAPLLVSTLMGQNPMMIYFGQELGEPGMDEEGFSGRDGRTSIFDYWTIDSIRRWRNKGKFNNELLTEKEIELRLFYQKILYIKEKNAIFCKGDFYDLMYVNPDIHQQYIFLRHFNGKLALVVANFADNDAFVQINIPEDVMRLYGIESSDSLSAIDLLSDKKYYIPFDPQSPIEITAPALGGLILSF